MSEMVEKVAKAIRIGMVGVKFDENFKTSFDNLPTSAKEMYMNAAKAAIEAMRELNLKILGAACDDNDKRGGRQGYTDIWHAMIDAALKE